MGSRQAEHNRGHAILNKLENVCLLDRCENGKYVKLHDVIKDMVINIKSSRFMVKIRRNFKNLPSKLEWSNNLERVQLMGRELSTLKFVPNCPKLDTLFLQTPQHPNLQLPKLCKSFLQSRPGTYEGLPESFFVHMLGLGVLDSSYIDIAVLPNLSMTW